ncbi:hypothetical protein LAUMK4_05802 [Mycobacterium persicum]|uniref:Uncharacterized protein n=1 Tax=Mycobacterium persicum TaxID=1487726 RepID=A0AB38V1V3_9MYCO|nr:hypothetical protein LAUMK15_05674 [Mycobacterium persicum]VAZ86728.1 hypothetical protein LAUMK42_05581 [Mycobacterium persicum]VBA32764.1 hypothetical protein LAUMK4_05802 [Mycobacterium persicum]
MKKPDRLAPTFPKPDALPVPELKKPDEGPVVEFPKPGAAGMSMMGILMGPMPPEPPTSITVSGPPMPVTIFGRSITKSGNSMGPTLTTRWSPVPRISISAVYGGSVNR